MRGLKKTGWAFFAYPDADSEYFERELRRQQQRGANFLWIGHNNPGETLAGKAEPALSYAVYDCLRREDCPEHREARMVCDAQRRLLDVCRKLSMPVVFPVGYQIQMGKHWNAGHQDCLRRHLDGSVIDWGGVSASFYAPEYQRDIVEYYRWIKAEWIDNYSDVIMLVNLADEPFGGDYSVCAERVFRERQGKSFAEARAGNVADREAVGRFQSEYIADYAAWSAAAWNDICPAVPCTMSFCGYHGREENICPSIPALFRDTPENFQPSFDVYPRDGVFDTALSENDITMLLLFLRQVAYLSAVYDKKYYCWTTGNSWGLSPLSKDPSDVADAVFNQLAVAAAAAENNGLLEGIAVWNYNCRNQGLFDDVYPTLYEPEYLFRVLTETLCLLRQCPVAPVAPGYAFLLDARQAYIELADCGETTNQHFFDFSAFEGIVKSGANFLMDDNMDGMRRYCEKNACAISPVIRLGKSCEGRNAEPSALYRLKVCGCTVYYNISASAVLLDRQRERMLLMQRNGRVAECAATAAEIGHHELAVAGSGRFFEEILRIFG